jgi:NADH-quinone oxidoreductase subunit G
MLLPSGTFAESQGTFVNNEGRAQRFYNVLPPEEPVKESWRWIRDLLISAGKKEAKTWQRFDDVVNSMTTAIHALSKIKVYIPDADFRMLNEKISRQTRRFSGRTAMYAHIAVSEKEPPPDPDSPLKFSMEGYNGFPPPSLIPFYWSPGWNSVQSMNKYLEEPNGSLKGGDPGIRLIETSDDRILSFHTGIPSAFKAKKGEWLIMPAYQIFGSEELSARGSAISKRISEPIILLNEKDAAGMHIEDKDTVTILINQTKLKVKVGTDANIPVGIAALSYALPGMPYLDLPEYGRWISNE